MKYTNISIYSSSNEIINTYDFIKFNHFDKYECHIYYDINLSFNNYLYFFNQFLYFKLPYMENDLKIIDIHFDETPYEDINYYKYKNFYNLIIEFNNRAFEMDDLDFRISRDLNDIKIFLLCKILYQ
jgi:hypothetical protein